jgi:pSer/pThr/pTyr-binding forkhead associated (FHA) protein
VIIIGREPGSDIVMSQGTVSRRHARVIRSGTQYRVEDLNSKYGVWVNGTKVSIHMLQPGDVIKVADDATISFPQITAAFNAKYGAAQNDSPRFQGQVHLHTKEMKPIQPHAVEKQENIYESPLMEDIPTKKWVEYLLLATVPIVGVVMLIVWMGDKRSPSRASWAKLMLILNVCFTVLLVIVLFTQIGFLI